MKVIARHVECAESNMCAAVATHACVLRLILPDEAEKGLNLRRNLNFGANREQQMNLNTEIEPKYREVCISSKAELPSQLSNEVIHMMSAEIRSKVSLKGRHRAPVNQADLNMLTTDYAPERGIASPGVHTPRPAQIGLTFFILI